MTSTSESSSTGRSTESMKVRLYLRAGLFAVIAPCVLACAAQTVIYEKTSPYNTILVTEDHSGLRTLLFERGGSGQTVAKPGDPEHLEIRETQGPCVVRAICEEHP